MRADAAARRRERLDEVAAMGGGGPMPGVRDDLPAHGAAALALAAARQNRN